MSTFYSISIHIRHWTEKKHKKRCWKQELQKTINLYNCILKADGSHCFIAKYCYLVLSLHVRKIKPNVRTIRTCILSHLTSEHIVMMSKINISQSCTTDACLFAQLYFLPIIAGIDASCCCWHRHRLDARTQLRRNRQFSLRGGPATHRNELLAPRSRLPERNE